MSNRSNSPQFFKKVFNATPVGLAIIDEQSVFLEVNEKLGAMFGYAVSELTNQHLSFLFPNLNQHEINAVQQTVLKICQPVQVALQGKTNEGLFIDVTVSYDLFTDENDGQFILASFTSSSEELKGEEDLNRRYRSVIENSIQAFFLTNPDGSILDANKAAEKMFGYTVQELCAIGRDAIIDKADKRVQQKLNERTENGFATGEVTGIRKNGEQFPIEFSSVVCCHINGEKTTSTIVSDITVRKEQEHQLLHSQQQMASILNNTEEMFMVIDKDYNVVNYNKASRERAKSILGKELMMGDSLLTLAEPERYALVKAVYEQVLAGKTIRYKHTVDRGLGIEHYQLTYSPIFNADKSCTSFMVTIRDITVEEKVLNEITQNQQLLQEAESIAHVGSWDLEIASNTLYWSDEVFRICGYEPKSFEITFENGFQFIHPDERASFLNELKNAIAAKTNYASDVRFVRPDGSIRYIKSKAKIILDKEGKAIRLIGVFHDITEQKVMERELAISQQQYKSLFDQNPDAVVSFDLQGKFVSVNDAGMLIAETTREKLLNDRFESFFNDSEVEVIRNYFKEVVKGSALQFQTIITTTTGKSKTVAVSLMPIIIAQEITGVYGILKDITEAKNAAQSLKVNEEQLNLVYNTTAGIIFLVGVENNGDDFRFISMNNAGLATIGFHKKDVFGQLVQHVIPEPSCSVVIAKYKEAIRFKKAIAWQEETTYPTGTKTGIVTVTPIFDNDGDCVRLVGSVKDITEQKLSELRLKDLYDQLEQRAAQLQTSNTELERFAYIASHDMQEPLRMISSFLQLLEKKYRDSIDEKGREYIRFAVDGSMRMKYLINDLLDYSRVSTRRQNLEQVCIDHVIEDVLQNLSLHINEKQAIINTSVLPLLPNADKTQMIQLFQNLIGNALKYSGSRQPLIDIEAAEKEDEWLFSIKDNGIGFDEKFADKIFVIFQRLHNRSEYSGTGIGLAICKKIIDRHGGKIYAESVPGEGSIFWFTIKKHLVAEQ